MVAKREGRHLGQLKEQPLTEQPALISPFLLQWGGGCLRGRTSGLTQAVFSTHAREKQGVLRRAPEYTVLETKPRLAAGVHNLILSFFLSGIRHQTLPSLRLIVLPADDITTVVTDTYYYRYNNERTSLLITVSVF